ncbi:unnamed protein product (macronuclear) [Paramecium tetraurelia]|uniref:Uncharacterized protein n=1 Tax=Paramecium tetraurelia TaxID=5888 RepID=A0CVG9_PARTE|nr:uncharacterized protein GSPATT00010954001 [Paramecium tetraurelia]CAK74786.1 unnamed protein product [Paramecium tetraurelia]|eukprot:XP_001442183.1 hypothetical protein (macronuclear) [Paramecium tetraurelia strain d4-2]
MDPIFYTFLGMGLGFMGSQVVMNNFFKNKQNKNPQQKQATKKFLPSTPDIKKAFQQNQIPFQIKRPTEVEDQIRKIVKIEPSPAQFDQDDELLQAQEQEPDQSHQTNHSDHNAIPQTPNFQNKTQAQPNIKLFCAADQMQQIVTTPIFLKTNKFSASQKNHPETTSSISQSEQQAGNNQKGE